MSILAPSVGAKAKVNGAKKVLRSVITSPAFRFKIAVPVTSPIGVTIDLGAFGTPLIVTDTVPPIRALV